MYSAVGNNYLKYCFSIRVILYAAIILSFSKLIYSQEDNQKVSSQNPSPMIENVREHKRIENRKF